MVKEKPKYKIKRWFTSKAMLKLVALLVAVLVWFYVRGEINRFNY